MRSVSNDVRHMSGMGSLICVETTPTRRKKRKTVHLFLNDLLKRDEELGTSDVTLISCDHGRQRRSERKIKRRELQEAVKYGKKERANPGRSGELRWRFTHRGVVHITDETCRQEITSWRIPTMDRECVHCVIVVDSSGSMRKDDIPNYPTRTAAVYDCLARDFVEPQLKKKGPAGADVAVTLIEMSDEATVVCDSKLDASLATFLRQRMEKRARSHGNYVPALNKVIEKFSEDFKNKQLFLLFLSDGSPSDAKNVHENAAVQKIRDIGQLFGTDRVFVGTIGFGPPEDDFPILRRMAEAVPRHSFQKLGLSAASLQTAFTSLTSSLASLRTDRRSLTRRTNLAKMQPRRGDQQEGPLSLSEFDIHDIVSKTVWCPQQRKMIPTDLVNGASGVAHAKNYFAGGAERVVFYASEIDATGCPIGPNLVAKQSVYEEEQQQKSHQYHETFCRKLSEADALAHLFNRRVNAGPETHVRYVQGIVYEVGDGLSFLAEPELDGEFTKWNNNNGRVKLFTGDDTIMEEEDEERVDPADVPQAFSHFTHSVTDGQKLVCDVQGVWNKTDGFLLTDPVIHSIRSKNGATDKGVSGIHNFFATHRCNGLCHRLGLSHPRQDILRVLLNLTWTRSSTRSYLVIAFYGGVSMASMRPGRTPISSRQASTRDAWMPWRRRRWASTSSSGEGIRTRIIAMMASRRSRSLRGGRSSSKSS